MLPRQTCNQQPFVFATDGVPGFTHIGSCNRQPDISHPQLIAPTAYGLQTQKGLPSMECTCTNQPVSE